MSFGNVRSRILLCFCVTVYRRDCGAAKLTLAAESSAESRLVFRDQKQGRQSAAETSWMELMFELIFQRKRQCLIESRYCYPRKHSS
jgi:hypothetical protein